MMKDGIKSAVYFLNNFFSKIFYFLFGQRNVKSALIMAPSWEGSLGDEAVLTSIALQLKNKGFKTTLIHWGDQSEWKDLPYIDEKLPFTNYFKTGGWGYHFRLIFQLPKYSHFYLMGTDMLDGCYADWHTLGMLRVAKQAAVAGLDTTLVGFSINTWQRENCISALKNFPSSARLCVRDKVSLDRLAALTQRNDLQLTADMAFLLQPNLTDPVVQPALQWISTKKLQGKIMVGLNINPQLFDNLEVPTDQVVKSFAAALEKVYASFQQNVSFFLLPHDFRPYNSDITLLGSLLDQLENTQVREDCFFQKEMPTAAGIKAIVGQLDVVVTGRMHVAIATLGQQVPLGCFVYQGKFEGLFQHFQLPAQYLMKPADALLGNNAEQFITKIIAERAIIKGLVKENFLNVKIRSAQNLERNPSTSPH